MYGKNYAWEKTMDVFFRTVATVCALDS